MNSSVALVHAVAFAARLRAPFLLLSVCLVVGKVAVVAIVLSFAVDVAGCESVGNLSVLRVQKVRSNCGRCTCRCRPRCPKVEAVAVYVVLALVVVVLCFSV